MPNKTPLQDAWNKYQEKCIPKDAGPVQIKESHQAFIAGAATVYMMLMAIAYNPAEECADQDIEMLGSCGQEIDDFQNQISTEAAAIDRRN